MPDLEHHSDNQEQVARQERAAAFWQRTIDDGRRQRQAGDHMAQTERQERTQTQRQRLSM
jgi:hypothetical protein